MSTNRPVVVMQVPEQLNREHVTGFLQDLEVLLEASRPRIVLDCSQVLNIDSAGVEMLLHCLEEAMKRDGDLKLAHISPESQVILELMRVDRVFEIFLTSEEAIRSFNPVTVDDAPQSAPWYASQIASPISDLGALKQAG